MIRINIPYFSDLKHVIGSFFLNNQFSICFILQIGNTTNAEFIQVKYDDCRDELSSNITCEEGWMYFNGSDWKIDKTAFLDCTGINRRYF